MTTSLVVLDTARRPMFSVGDPVTVSLATSYDVADNVTSCARVMRIVPGTVFVKVIGLNVPAPYRVGDTVPIDTNKVIDWQSETATKLDEAMNAIDAMHFEQYSPAFGRWFELHTATIEGEPWMVNNTYPFVGGFHCDQLTAKLASKTVRVMS